jgi:hypothetical protein
MEGDKETGFNPASEEKEQSNLPQPQQNQAPRARNRTVMLTPDVTGQVRARMAQGSEPPPAFGGFLPQGSGGPQFSQPSDGFESVRPPSTSAQRGISAPANGAFSVPQQASYQAPQPAYQQQYQAAPQQQFGRAAGVSYTKVTPVVGFLVSFDKNAAGEVYELRSGRLIVTSDSGASGNVMYVDDPSVSVGHAILRISTDGDIQVLDQLSEFGTKIRRSGSNTEEELSGDKSSLDHGDVVRFGERKFNVCLLTLPEEGEG